VDNTLEHSRKLGLFVLLYKTQVCLLTRVYDQSAYNSLIAGMSAGYVCFRKKTAINYQIVLYLFSRILTGGI